MRKIIAWTMMAIAIQASVASCQRGDDEPNGRPPLKAEDWKDGGTFETNTDEGRPMTHEDSIRFGLI